MSELAAHHKAISRQRWQASQRHELRKWRGSEVLERATERLRASYVPYLLRYTRHLSDQAEILEIGCGPVCISQLIERGRKTFLDPLLDDFRRIYPGKLPEGRYLSAMAEDVPCPDRSFDCIVCINTLGYVLNPELVLNEMERLLRPGGVIIIGMTLFSSLEARLQYILRHCWPSLGPEGRPYCYSHAGMLRTLKRHFAVQLDTPVRGQGGALRCRWPHVFVCTHEGERLVVPPA